MFLQNLRKKLAELFSADTIKQLVINNFRDILIIISAMGILFILLIISCLLIFSRPKKAGNQNEEITETVELRPNIDFVPVATLLSPHDFIKPEIKSFDITSDYIPFLSNRPYQAPDLDIVHQTKDRVLYETIQKSYQFPFEKRKVYREEKQK